MQVFRILCYLFIANLSVNVETLLAKSAKKDAKTDKKKGGHGEAAGPVADNPAESITITDNYVQQWMMFPPLKSKDVLSGATKEIKSEKGTALVVFFIASWCVPCQKMVDNLQKLSSHFANVHARFVYVMSHDTIEDAKAFAKDHNITGDIVLADQQVLRDFHNPKLPSVYLSDRRGWLNKRYVEVTAKELNDLERTLNLMTAF